MFLYQRSVILALLALLLSSATTFCTSATEQQYSVLHSTLLQIASNPALVAQELKIFITTIFEYSSIQNFNTPAILLYTHILYGYAWNKQLLYFFKKCSSILQYFGVLLEYYFSVIRSIQNAKIPVLNTPEILRSITKSSSSTRAFQYSTPRVEYITNTSVLYSSTDSQYSCLPLMFTMIPRLIICLFCQ